MGQQRVEPAGWVDRVPMMLSGPGVHQIRLRSHGNGESGRVDCVCGVHLAVVRYGGDVWGPFRAHEKGVPAV